MRAIMPLWIIAAGFRISFVVFITASAAGQASEVLFQDPVFEENHELLETRRSMGVCLTFAGVGATIGSFDMTRPPDRRHHACLSWLWLRVHCLAISNKQQSRSHSSFHSQDPVLPVG
jgi:hypothetical protein